MINTIIQKHQGLVLVNLAKKISQKAMFSTISLNSPNLYKMSIIKTSTLPELEEYRSDNTVNKYGIPRWNLAAFNFDAVKLLCNILDTKSIMVSCLVKHDNQNLVVSMLKQFGQQLVNIDITNNWYGKLLIHSNTQFSLVNLLLTNNDQPKIIFYGHDIYNKLRDTINDYNKNILYQRTEFYNCIFMKPDFSNLNKCVYLWQFDSFSNIYQTQLVNLAPKVSNLTLNQTINQFAKTVIDKYIANFKTESNQKKFANNDQDFDSIINVTLDWLFVQVSQLHDLKSYKYTYDKNLPEGKQVLKYLAQQLNK